MYFKNAKDTHDDGELHTYEVYDLNVKARLAVLTACESGVGKFFKGEGLFSIARSFDYAGCPSTVITLWGVSDKASAQIMTRFYQELRNGSEINEALHDAKLSYINGVHSQLAHPSFWAAFVLTGKTDPVVNSNRNIFTVIFICIAGGAAVLVYFMMRKRRTVKTRERFSTIGVPSKKGSMN